MGYTQPGSAFSFIMDLLMDIFASRKDDIKAAVLSDRSVPANMFGHQSSSTEVHL